MLGIIPIFQWKVRVINVAHMQGRRSWGIGGGRVPPTFELGDEYLIVPFFHMFNEVLLFHDVKT